MLAQFRYQFLTEGRCGAGSTSLGQLRSLINLVLFPLALFPKTVLIILDVYFAVSPKSPTGPNEGQE